MIRSATKAAILLLSLVAVLALVDAAYHGYRAIDDAEARCPRYGVAGEACRTLRHGFVHVRVVAALEALAVAAVAGLASVALAWARRRAATTASPSRPS